MAERTDQRTRDSDVEVGLDDDFDVGGGSDTPAAPETTSGSRLPSLGVRQRISERVGSIFSVRLFGVLLVVTTVLSFVTGGLIPLVPDTLGGLAGVFAVGLGVGVVSSRRHYLEVGTASAFAGVLSAVLGNLILSVAGNGGAVVAFGALASAVIGLLGHYFGRDLRAGLTRDI